MDEDGMIAIAAFHDLLDADREPARYSVEWRDDEGVRYGAEGDTLEALATDLAEQNYPGPTLEVRDERGFVRGWVSARGEWRHA